MSKIFDRRNFLKLTGIAGTGSLAFGCSAGMQRVSALSKSDIAEGPLIRDVMKLVEERKDGNIRPQIRSEILENPKAVFIIETSVKAEKDAKGSYDSAGPQLEEAGYLVATTLFEKGNTRGGKTTINPNWTSISKGLRYPTIGITTAPYFVAGFAEGLRELGNTNFVVTERSSGANMLREAGHLDILAEHNIPFIDAHYKHFRMYEKDELNWFKIPDGLVWKRVPTFRPHFDKDAFNINIPTMKCHNLGLTTLSIKNMQGLVPDGYGHYCDRFHQMYTIRPEMRKDIKGDFWQTVEKEFLRHRSMGYKYYDIEGSYPVYRKKGGWNAFKKVRKNRRQADEFMKGVKNLMWDEQWAQRTVDTLAVFKPDINIIEGIISRDGNAFENGTDYLTNYVIASRNLVAVDSVTSYLMGHNPTELHYLRIADERGYGPINLDYIPVYIIKGKEITRLKDYRTLKRYRLGIDLHRRPKEPLRFF